MIKGIQICGDIGLETVNFNTLLTRRRSQFDGLILKRISEY